MSEAAIQKAILAAVNCIPGCLFWRNNSGQARIRGLFKPGPLRGWREPL